MARKYSVSSGLTSIGASTTIVACQMATNTTTTLTVLGFDVSFDGTATGSGIIPVRVQLVRPTAASSGGATMTPTPWLKGDLASATTARKNDTSAGSSPTVIKEWLVSPSAGISYLFPLGRELSMPISDFLELKLVSQTGMTTCNYVANIDFEE